MKTLNTQRGEEQQGEKCPPFALIVVNSPIPSRKQYFSHLWSRAKLRICADGGGNRLFDHDDQKFVPDLIAGDMDSLLPSTREFYSKKGTTIMRIQDPDTTDLEKCLLQMNDIEKRQGQTFSNVFVIGGLGGNFSHELANVNILYKYHQRRIFLLSELNLSFLLLPGKHMICTTPPHSQGLQRIFCSLSPVGTKCRSITTKGLRWDLVVGSMQFGALVSTSNEMVHNTAEVEVSDPVLWTFDLRPEEEAHI